MQQQPPLPPPIPTHTPGAAPTPKKPSELRQILVGGLAFIGILVGLFALAMGYVALVPKPRVSESAPRPIGVRRLVVDERAIAEALGPHVGAWRTDSPGHRSIESTIGVVVVIADSSPDVADVDGVSVRVVVAPDQISPMDQAYAAGNVLAAVADGWPSARAWVLGLLLGEMARPHHVGRFVFSPYMNQRAAGVTFHSFDVSIGSAVERPTWMNDGTWEVYVWSQRIAAARKWSQTACFLASRCVFADPFTFRGQELHFAPGEFDACNAEYGSLCRAAVSDLTSNPPPAGLDEMWTRLISDGFGTIDDLAEVARIRARYPSVELRADGTGYEDYSEWLLRHDGRAANEWINRSMTLLDSRLRGVGDFEAWVSERMCCVGAGCAGVRLFDLPDRAIDLERVPHQVGDSACAGSTR